MGRFSKDQNDWLFNISKEVLTRKEITCKFNQKFNQNRPVSSINKWFFRHGIKTGRDFRFKSGYIHKVVRIGGTRINTQTGCLMVKSAEPDIWVRATKYVWEKANGPVPKGMCVKLKDVRKKGQWPDLQDLELISNHELLVRNTLGYDEVDVKYKQTTANVAKLIVKVSNIRNKRFY